MLERCSCGHLPTEHVITAGSAGFGIHECQASKANAQMCACPKYTPGSHHSVDIDIDEELFWRAA
jgi:hypothetical protein